jgi:uncharacterized protein
VLDRYESHPDYLGIDLHDVNQSGAVDDRPLHIASRSGDPEQVAQLIDLGADVNASGDLGSAPLHCAAMKGCWPIALLLLERGANIDARNEFGETALDVARIGGQLGFVEKLVSLMGDGAALEVKNS